MDQKASARRRGVLLAFAVVAATPNGPVARADVLEIGVCSVETPRFCEPGELEKKKREAAAAEAKRRREAAARAERERLASDPAYRAKKEAEAREAARKAAEAKKAEDILVAKEVRALGLPQHRAGEARSMLRMRLASERARKPPGPPPPGIFATSAAPTTAATKTAGPAPVPPKVCPVVQTGGPIGINNAMSESAGLAMLRRETQSRCLSAGRPVPYTLTGQACTSANYALKVKILPNGKTVKDTERADDIRWACKGTYACAIQRCETKPAGTTRQ